MVIVAVVDRSDRAPKVVTEASKLSRAFEQPLHVVYVLTTSEFVELEQSNVEKEGTTINMERVKEFASTVAEDVADRAGVSATAIGLVGETSGEIINYAAQKDAEYVVIGSQKRSPTGKAVFGSDAQSVILNAPCPVLSIVET